MKNNILITSVAVLILLSSCSNKRFGRIPKVKAQPKKEQTAKRKTAKKQITLSVKTALPIILPKQIINAPTVALPQIPAIKKQADQPVSSAKKTTTQNSKNKATSINNTKENRTQNSSSFFEDFWDTGLGEFVLYIVVFIVIILIYIFVEWLISIGLAWLVFILGLALLIYILYLLNELLNDVLDFLFRR